MILRCVVLMFDRIRMAPAVCLVSAAATGRRRGRPTDDAQHVSRTPASNESLTRASALLLPPHSTVMQQQYSHARSRLPCLALPCPAGHGTSPPAAMRTFRQVEGAPGRLRLTGVGRRRGIPHGWELTGRRNREQNVRARPRKCRFATGAVRHDNIRKEHDRM